MIFVFPADSEGYCTTVTSCLCSTPILPTPEHSSIPQLSTHSAWSYLGHWIIFLAPPGLCHCSFTNTQLQSYTGTVTAICLKEYRQLLEHHLPNAPYKSPRDPHNQ